MTNIVIFWIATGTFFLIIEAVSATFYGLSLAIGAFIVALYIHFVTGDAEFTITQAVIFTGIGAVASYFFPEWLSPKEGVTPQGLDRYFGKKGTVKEIDGDFKISLDGVDYMLKSDDDIQEGDRVKLIGRDGGLFCGEKI